MKDKKNLYLSTNISDDIEYVLEDADIVQVIIPSSFIEYYAKVMSHL